ncbi:MAG: TerC family protein [Bacteroidota bacterium]
MKYPNYKMMIGTTWLWIGFNLFVLLMLILDLGVFHQKSREVKIKEALLWTGIWIFLALLFNTGIFYFFGKEKAIEFLTGYIIEKSLSIDNIFIFIIIFSYFSVPAEYQHKVLFWGIFGALTMRIIFIFAGLELIHRFHWIIYLFGAFLIYTGIKMLFPSKQLDPDKNLVLKSFKRLFPVTDNYHGTNFFIKQNSKTVATRLFLVLLLIEVTDLIFAVDSIPAILAISDDPFIVYTSNVFAILGLRSLYFAFAGINHYFHYLKIGLSAILVFVGIKMCIVDFYKIPVTISLLIIISILLLSIIASKVFPKKEIE